MTEFTLHDARKSGILLEYEEAKMLFEKQVALILYPTPMYVDRWEHRVSLNTKRELVAKYGCTRCRYADKRDFFLKLWLEDEEKLTFHKAVCIPPPLACPSTVYNLWSGFAIDSVSIESSNSVEPFLNHLNALTENNVNRIIHFLAQLVQEPGNTSRPLSLYSYVDDMCAWALIRGIGSMIGNHLYQEISKERQKIAPDQLLIHIWCKKYKIQANNSYCRYILSGEESTDSIPISPDPDETEFTHYMSNTCNQKAVMDFLRSVSLIDLKQR